MANNVLRGTKQHAATAKIELTAPLNVHSFRKSFGQNHADGGTPIHVLQQLMGHSKITTTREFYLRVSKESERGATDRYARILGGAVNKTCRNDARSTSEPVGSESR